MPHTSTASGIIVTLGMILLLAVAALIEPDYALAQQPTPTPAPEPTITIQQDTSPWWQDLGGMGTLALALVAILGTFTAFLQYRRQRETERQLRERELEQRQRHTALDLAELQGDLVARCQREYDLARGTPGEAILRGELERAEVEYEAIVRGIMLTDKEMQKLRIEALHAFMELARRERERLRREIGG